MLKAEALEKFSGNEKKEGLKMEKTKKQVHLFIFFKKINKALIGFLKRWSWFIVIFLLLTTANPLSALSFESKKFSVTGPSPYLQQTVKKIYEQGGNAVDMAVAGAFTLSVATPFYASLGAGGFALVDMGQGVQALDFREKAPQSVHAEYYKDKSSVLGGSAVGVPGFVYGLWELHQKYGKISWKKLLAPAIFLAEKGYLVGGEWAQITKNITALDYGMTAFFKKDRKPYLPGEVIKQKKLGRALKRIRRKNIKAFYQGSIAEDVVSAVSKNGGVMALDDLKNYRPRWLKPQQRNFMGYEVYVMPPPSSGALVIFSALDLILNKNLPQYPILSVDELHLFSEIMSRSFRLRNLTGDPDFYKTSFEKLLSPESIKKAGDSISLKKAVNVEPIKETTHLAVMDAEGRAVTMTLTLNLQYGSKVVTPQYGIVLNNQMDDFTTAAGQANAFGLVQGRANLVEPGKRPLSSMSPTLVKKNGNTVMVLGASGGPRIISGVLQTLYRVLAQEIDMDTAIQMPRVHHQFLPRVTYVEKNRLSPDVLKMLSDRKHIIKEVKNLGKVYGIKRGEDKILKSAFDSRGDGMAWGM